MTKIIKFGAIVFYIAILGILVLFDEWLEVFLPGKFLSSLFYWLVLAGWIGLVFTQKLRSGFSFKSGIILFSLASLFFIFGFVNLAEIPANVGLIVWGIATIQAIIEYRNA